MQRVQRRSRSSARVAGAEDRRAAVERARRGRCRPGRASPRRPGCAAGAPVKRDPGAAAGQPVGALEHLDHGEVPVDLEHHPVAVRLAVRRGPSTNSSQPDAAARRSTTSSGPRSPPIAGVLDDAPTRSWPGLPRCEPVQRPPGRRRGATPTPVDVRRAGLVARPQQRAAVDLLEHARRAPRARPAPGTGRATASTASTSAAPFSGEQSASSGDSALCCSTASRSSRPASSTIRSGPGSEPMPDQLGQRGQPVGLGEQRRGPGPPPRPVGVAVAACQAPSGAASRENEPVHDTAG